jgi:hypothetical protein
LADDPALDRLIASLDASFDASVARQEDEAASDLAFSLLQGRSFIEALRGRSLALCLPEGGRAPVVALGRDYVVGGGMVVPLLRSVLVAGSREPPSAREDSLLEVLRRWARAGREVEVSTASGTFAGTLVCAAEDHLELRSGRGQVLLGRRAVEWVRGARGGRGDEL